jgi:DNA-directed RNA polymerase subunit RPC12/RpoP
MPVIEGTVCAPAWQGPMASSATTQNDQPVLCPRCQRPMMRGRETPIMFTSGLSNMVYSCESCHTETVRTVNSDGSPHTAGVVGDKV